MYNILSVEQFRNFDEFVSNSFNIIFISMASKIVIETFAPALLFATSFTCLSYLIAACYEITCGNKHKSLEYIKEFARDSAFLLLIGSAPSGIIPLIACALIIFRSYGLIRSTLPNSTKIGACLKSIEDFFNDLEHQILRELVINGLPSLG
jgi:hypothetical protein